MGRVNLVVPFSDKETVKKMGGRWDGVLKVWFAPADVDPGRFEKWMVKPPSINLRAPSGFHLARTGAYCWSCKAPTWVYGLYFEHQPVIIERYDMVDGELHEIYSHDHHGPGFASFVEYINPEVEVAIRAIAPVYRFDVSAKSKQAYFMNHCGACGMKQGDFELYHEPESPFHPLSEVHVQAIQRRYIPMFLDAAHGSYHTCPDVAAGTAVF